MKEFPKELCNFQDYTVAETDGNWWEANDLMRIDVLGNEIETIPEEIGT